MPACFGNGNLDMKATKEIDELVRVIKAVAPRAEKEGITLALENYLSAKDNMAIIDRIGSPAMKVYYDVGNSTDKGYDIYAEIRELGKHGLLCEFHAKDGPAILGQGRIDFKRVRQAMDDAAFRGWIQLESAKPNGVVPDYRTQCKFLKAIFPDK
jgi:L-ribulose-5-phosphate 3-epimerase